MGQAASRRPPTADARVRSRGQSMWDLWWTKWHWDRLFSEYFGFPLSVSFHRCSITRKRTKNNNNNHHHHHLHHRVAQEASRLRCARSVCCGALHHLKKKDINIRKAFIFLSQIWTICDKSYGHDSRGRCKFHNVTLSLLRLSKKLTFKPVSHFVTRKRSCMFYTLSEINRGKFMGQCEHFSMHKRVSSDPITWQ
jgi:hypothetical protein